MRTTSHTLSTEGKRSGAAAVVRAYERQGQPSNHVFAGLLPIDWRRAGP